MELQQLGLGLAASVPWKKKKKNVVAHKHKRSSEEDYNNVQDDDTDSSPSPLLVWYGQPNEDDDDNRPKKHLKPSCTTFAANNDIDDGEGQSNRVVGWPPVESFRKKLLYGGPHQQQPEINIAARLARNKEINGRSNNLMIPLSSSGKIVTNTRRGRKQCKINPYLP